MKYDKRLPQLLQLISLSEAIRFPTTGASLLATAQKLDASRSIVDFLALFSPGDTFHSRQDFIASCEELELLIREGRKMPHEVVLAS